MWKKYKRLLVLGLVLVLIGSFTASAQPLEPKEDLELALGVIGATNEFVYSGLYGYNQDTITGITGRVTFNDVFTVRTFSVSGTRTWETSWRRFEETNATSELLLLADVTLSESNSTEITLRPGLGFGSKWVKIEDRWGRGTYTESFSFNFAPTFEIGIEVEPISFFAGAQLIDYDTDQYLYRDTEGMYYTGFTYKFELL